MGRRGFTLIELLVVISIVSLLAAILFPVLARSKQAAMATSCSSNMRNLAIAVRLYDADYDGILPLAVTVEASGVVFWNDLLDPYVRNEQVWQCMGSDVRVTDGDGRATTHYGYNTLYLTSLLKDFSNVFSSSGRSVDSISAPSETVLFSTARASIPTDWCGDDGRFLLPPSETSAPCWGRPAALFTDRVPVAWVDSHMSKPTFKQFYDCEEPVDRFFDGLGSR